MFKGGIFENYEVNKCRLCSKIFCCKKCREKHEILAHDIVLDCDICVYGTIRVSSISESLLTHISIVHWPLRCVCCNRVFSYIEELFQNQKCAAARYILEKSFSPVSIRCYDESNNYQSPPDQPIGKNQKSCLVTSTPMQINEQNNFELKKIQEVITPVDYSGHTKDSILKKGNQTQNSDLPKRRVTFSTPVTDNEKQDSETEENIHHKENTKDSILPYYTAQDFHQMTMDKISTDFSSNSYKSTPKLPGLKKTEGITNNEERLEVVVEENKTLWISAMNGSLPQNILESFATPTVPIPKREMNLRPITVIEKITKCTGAIQISSTPNSSIIPVKSIPTAKDIFRGESSKSLECDTGLEATNTSKEIECYNQKSDSSIRKNIWTSVCSIMKNFAGSLQTISTIEGTSETSTNNTSLKRYSSQESIENPHPKRFKLTEIKCRPSIRGLPRPREDTNGEICINIVTKTSIERTNIIANSEGKIFVDKSTQTDDYLYKSENFFTNLFRKNCD